MSTPDFFCARLDGMVDPRHPLVVLTDRLAWAQVEQVLAPHFERNQPTLQEDIRLLFAPRGRAHHSETSPEEHGRIETCRIWCSSRLNDYLDFPHVGQVFLIEREVIDKKSGHHRSEVALGVTSRTPSQAPPADLLRINRGHWSIENSGHYVLDMTWDEDRCRIRTGHGPEDTSRLRSFAISVLNLRARPGDSIASMTRKLAAKTRLVFDYLLMTRNSTGHARPVNSARTNLPCPMVTRGHAPAADGSWYIDDSSAPKGLSTVPVRSVT